MAVNVIVYSNDPGTLILSLWTTYLSIIITSRRYIKNYLYYCNPKMLSAV